MKTQHQQPQIQNNQSKEDDFDEVWVPNPHGLQDSAATHGLIDNIKSGNLNRPLAKVFCAII